MSKVKSKEHLPQERTSISISKASRMLGVSEAALRQWTDEGKIKAFVTPGGHRRYVKAELKRLIGKQQRVHGIKDLVTKIETTPSMHKDLAQTYFSNATWYSNLNAESQKHLAESGRKLLQLVIRYIAEPAKQVETEELAKEVGGDFGEQVAKLGLSLIEAMEIFMLHRNPVLNAVTELLKRKEALNERAVEALPMVTHILDEALIALVTSYQRYRGDS